MRELIVLGTASQVPTRHRNHNGYLLLWDGSGILFDPGEGTQRQMSLAGIAVSSIDRICITHFHGDHCLGLPGITQRLSLDGVDHPVRIHYPASGQLYLDRLLGASVFEPRAELLLEPVRAPGPVDSDALYTISAERLDHVPETFGWRVEEPAGRTLLPECLREAGIEGPDVGKLVREGSLRVPSGRLVMLEEVSVARAGQVMAFIMDTRYCEAAVRLASGADLLVCEATFADGEAELAVAYHHLTARQAGEIAAASGARQLVITHFSQRYPNEQVLIDQARAVFPDAIAARDLMRIPLPHRRTHKPQGFER